MTAASPTGTAQPDGHPTQGRHREHPRLPLPPSARRSHDRRDARHAGDGDSLDATGCPDVPVDQPFAAWSDTADYFLAPDGGFEAGGEGWALRGRAAVTGGDAPVAGAHSLRLPAGGAATSPPFCIGVEHRSMRFFASAATTSTLSVDVLYTDERGKSRSERVGELAGAGEWAPTDVMPMVVNTLAADRDNAMTVQIRIAPHGAGAWTIDDVLVDPYRGR